MYSRRFIASPDHNLPLESKVDKNVPQCGYCQPGFMMAAAKLIDTIPNPTDDDIKNNISNICRCGTHPHIIKAIKRVTEFKQANMFLLPYFSVRSVAVKYQHEPIREAVYMR